MLSSIVEAYERLVIYFRILLGLQLKHDNEQATGIKTIESLEKRINEHLRSTMRALQALVEAAVKLNGIAKSHMELLDRTLLDELDALNNGLQTILIPSEPSSGTLAFQNELKNQIAYFASSLVLQRLMKRVEQQQVVSAADIRHFIRTQISLLSQDDSSLPEGELGKLLAHSPLKPLGLAALILRLNRGMKVPISMLPAMVPRTATFLVRKMKLATDLRGDSIDEVTIRSIMTYDKYLRTEIVRYRNGYRVFGTKLKEQCSKQATASGTSKLGTEACSALYVEAGHLLSEGVGQIVDPGTGDGSTPLDPAMSTPRDSTDRMLAKPSDLFLFVTRERDAIIQNSIMTISQLSGGVIFSPNTRKTLEKEFRKTVELLSLLMAKQILLDEPLTATTVLDLLNQNIETDSRFEQTLAPLYARIIGSVIVTKSREVWT
jgi:hypothetical protein